MKHIHSSVMISSAVAMVLAAQPVLAQVSEITNVILTPVDGGITVMLKTSDQQRPQVFTTKKDKSLVANIINTKLRLPENKNFRQENPAPGIASVEVNQLDGNSIQVIVTGINNVPNSQPLTRKDNNLTLGFSINTGTVADNPANNPTDNNSSKVAETNNSGNNSTENNTSKVTQAPATAPSYNPNEPGKRPDVLVPNPQVLIDGKPAQSAGPGQPLTQAPPFLPRAVAPPVGDMSVSNIDTSPMTIDLGTQERVPRLVLRDAPVREVLSLLARAAGLNVVYSGGGGEDAKDTPAGGGADATKTSQTISLDIENEPVQDVFNYVLRLSGLEANRTGRTIFVGTKLPNSTRDITMRSLRLNQVTVGVALNFLVAMGAESAVSRERLVTSVNAVPVGGNSTGAVTQTQTTTETKLETQRVEYKDSKPLLRGLQASGDERTNSVTLVGSPKMVEMAIAQLTQLDVRRRQVVVNVKIIDVNLSGIQDYNSSFSFGFGNNYFTNDGGAATFNFGGSRPATGTEVETSLTSTPIGTSTAASGGVFFDPQTGKAISGITSTPTEPGVTNIDSGTTGTTFTYKLPTLYQFPKRLLASLQAQVTNGNAKILTDPTLIVQEGQQAVVNLTEQVIGNIKNEVNTSGATTTQTYTVEKENVGLTLAVKIERVDDNGFVSLSVSPSVKAPLSSQQVTLLNSTTQTIFLVSERSLQSGLIRLRDGQTLILSGIIQDQDKSTVTKIPILGDLPLIGSLFRKTNRQNDRKEVIVLVTPQVMDDSERSSYGYNYSPSPQIRDVLERRGVKVQPK